MTEPPGLRPDASLSSQHVTVFCRAVERYMEHGAPTEPVHLAARLLAAEALRCELRPEEILAAIKRELVRPLAISERHGIEQSRRYSQSIHVLVTAYFAQCETGCDVIDQEGRRWHVYLVEEGGRWDPEIEMRRHNWLCCQSGDLRRFIAPVPQGWRSWSVEALAAAIAAAPTDHRAGSLG